MAAALSSIVIARSIPVDEFGVYSYVVSLCSIGIAIVGAGLNGLAVRELVTSESRQGLIMTTLVVLRQLFAVAAYCVLVLLASSSGSDMILAATAIAALSLFVRAFDTPDFWFQATLRARVTAIIRAVASLVWLGVRVLIALTYPDLWVFLLLFMFEPVVVTTIVITKYWRYRGSPRFKRPQVREMKRLLALALPVTLSSVADQVNSRGDVIIIQALSTSTNVGLYSAAARLSEMAYFVPNAFMAGTAPALMRIRAEFGGGSKQYRDNIQRSLDGAFWLGTLFAGALFLLGGTIISLLYGADYAESAPVLAVHVLACPFVFMAAVASKWMIIEGLLWASFLRHLVGALVNITLNLLLFPQFGIVGSAWATVGSYFVASYLAFFIGRSTIPLAKQMTLSFVYPIRFLWSTLNVRRGRA